MAATSRAASCHMKHQTDNITCAFDLTPGQFPVVLETNIAPWHTPRRASLLPLQRCYGESQALTTKGATTSDLQSGSRAASGQDKTEQQLVIHSENSESDSSAAQCQAKQMGRWNSCVSKLIGCAASSWQHISMDIMLVTNKNHNLVTNTLEICTVQRVKVLLA